MESKNLNELSTEELLKQQKKIKLVTGFLAGTLAASLALDIFTIIQKLRFTALVIIPFALLPIVFLNLSMLKKIKKELDSRIIMR